MKKILSTLAVMSLVMTSLAQSWGPSGVWISAGTTTTLYRLNTVDWGQSSGYFNTARPLFGSPMGTTPTSLGTPTSLVISRGIVVSNWWTSVGSHWAIFYQVYKIGGETTNWGRRFVTHVDGNTSGLGNNRLHRTDAIDVDILALARTLATEGDFELRIGIRQAGAPITETSPEEWRTVTFRMECIIPNTPEISSVLVCSGANTVSFEVENFADFGEPTFTLWTAAEGGTQIADANFTFNSPTLTFTRVTPFTTDVTYFLQVEDASYFVGCRISQRGAVNIVVVEAPSDFSAVPFAAGQGESDGGIEFTPGVRGLGPFTITIDGTTINAANTGVTTFDGLATGYHDAIITATGNPAGCQTYTIYQIYVEQSACAFPATPTLVMANVCDGFTNVLVEITNHTAGITYRLVSSADVTLIDNLTVDASNRVSIPTQAIGYYYLRAVNTALATGCQVSTGRVRVLTVHGVPANPQVSFSAAACVGQTVEVTIQNFDANYDYVLYLGTTALTTVSITSATFSTPQITENTTFTLRKNSRVTSVPAGCRSGEVNIAITASARPEISVVPTHTYGTDGSIAVTVTSGNAPFSVAIGDETTNNVALNIETLRGNLAPGVHTVSVTDANGCVVSETATINQLVATFGEGPAGIYFRVNGVDNERFRLSGAGAWVAGDMGSAPVLDGHNFGTLDELYFSWARAIAWSAAGNRCGDLWNRFVVFYRVTNVENPNTPWMSVRLDHCDDAAYAGNNARLRTQPGTSPSPFQAVDILAVAYTLGGYGTYTLEMAMVFDINSHTMDTPPANRIRTATFTMEVPSIAVATRTPAIDATGVGLNAPVAVTFNQPVTLNTPNGITISEGVTVISASIIDGHILSIEHSGFVYDVLYTVTIPAGVITDYDEAIVWSFRTVQEGLPIEVEATTPANDATSVALNASITVRFNQDIVLSTPHNITISDDVTVTSANVIGNLLTIVHSGLIHETTHTVTIPVGAIIGHNEEIAWSFTTINRPAATFGEGPSGVYLSVDATERRFRLSTETWSQGPEDMGGSPVLGGYDFGTLEEFYFSWARARAWSHGDACAVLDHKFVVFYRVTNNANANTPWIPVLLNYCDAAIYAGDNVRLRTRAAWEPVNIRALAYALGGYGTYTLEMAVVFHANSHSLNAPPAERIRTATFTIEEIGPPPPPLEVVERSPEAGATNVAADVSITVRFNRDIMLSPPHNITISGGVSVISASVSGSVLTIIHGGFAYETTHTVTIPAGALVGLNQAITWSFTIGSEPPTSLVEVDDVRLVVYPNPVFDILHIENPTNELLTVEIYTLSGVRVATFTNVQTSIDLSHLPSGTYLLRIGTRVVRIVKN